MWRASLKVKNTAPITRRYIEWLTLFVFYKQNNVCLGSMLSKKSFLANERNVLAPLVRPTRGNVRDHIESHKKRSQTFVHALQRLAAAETTKN